MTPAWILLTTLALFSLEEHSRQKAEPEVKGTSDQQCGMPSSEDCLPRVTGRSRWRRGLERLWVRMAASAWHLHSPNKMPVGMCRILASCTHRLLTHFEGDTFLPQLKQNSKPYGTLPRVLALFPDATETDYNRKESGKLTPGTG